MTIPAGLYKHGLIAIISSFLTPIISLARLSRAFLAGMSIRYDERYFTQVHMVR